MGTISEPAGVKGKSMGSLSCQLRPSFAKFSAPTVGWLHGLRQWNGWLIMLLATGPALASCFHYFILKDTIFQKMLIKKDYSDANRQ
ncbi:hypothetical protein [Acetobacter fabarum]|uniref:hypothetical protein n=1 Tax=Acetobacter fabarum TaxID=483199 RepID=UPI00209DD06C|nr:hypothetical protein [Acetobacter fabarum]MCP1228814.1 hypothetical protein [Acetobacter fabarum]MCP1234309.1 hypothetical protein [Acetobacter fabarum]